MKHKSIQLEVDKNIIVTCIKPKCKQIVNVTIIPFILLQATLHLEQSPNKWPAAFVAQAYCVSSSTLILITLRGHPFMTSTWRGRRVNPMSRLVHMHICTCKFLVTHRTSPLCAPLSNYVVLAVESNIWRSTMSRLLMFLARQMGRPTVIIS